MLTYPHKYVEIYQNQNEVVYGHGVAQFEWLALLHELWAGNFHKVNVSDYHGNSRKRTLHQGPILDSGIYKMKNCGLMS